MEAVAGSLEERGRRVELSGGQCARLGLAWMRGRAETLLSFPTWAMEKMASFKETERSLAHLRKRKKCNSFSCSEGGRWFWMLWKG